MNVIAVTAKRRRHARTAGLATACALTGCLILGAAAAASTTAPAAAQTGSLIGQVTAPAATAAATTVPVAGVTVTATGPTGVVYTTSTTANGGYDLEQLPAPATYLVSVRASAAQTPQTESGVAVTPGQVTTASAKLSEPAATITGRVTAPQGRPLDGMPVGLNPAGPDPCPAGGICGPSTTSGTDGGYTLNVAPGSYELAVQDGSQLIDEAPVDATADEPSAVNVPLPAPAVPVGTAARHAGRDLQWLNAERASAGLPAGVVLNSRWSQECAAHDAYEQANGVLAHTENPQAPGASPGGAWAGLTSVLAQASWTSAANPWENAPIHLLQLFSPSLSVIGIDDGDGRQCATTYPGLLRAPVSTDTVSTYPADGMGDVPASENAREAPFVPGQFVGIPAGQTTGRDLFAYLNLAGQVGQAQVKVLSATLTTGPHALAVKWVDNSTRTVGQYLTGAILIPVAPLHPRTTYRATVTVQDRSGTLTHSWGFSTGAR